MLKKHTALLLAIVIVFTMVGGGAIHAAAAPVGHGTYKPSEGVETYKYYFAMPGSWINNSTHENNDVAGVYWWSAPDDPDTKFGHGWPGYEMDKEDGYENLWSVNAPKLASILVFNNYLDSGMDSTLPIFKNAQRCLNKNVEYYIEGESDTYSQKFWEYMWTKAAKQIGIDTEDPGFDYTSDEVYEAMIDPANADKIDFSDEFGEYGKNFFAELENETGLAMNFQNMVYVVDLDPAHIKYVNEDLTPGGKPAYDGEFYFYYGNGEYGMWPTKAMALKMEGVTDNGDGTYTGGAKVDDYGTVFNKDGQVIIGNFDGLYSGLTSNSSGYNIFDTPKLGLGVNESCSLRPSNNKSYAWKSSDSSVATVDINGKVTGKKAGSATITAEGTRGEYASCVVTVKPAPTSISINPTSLSLNAGDTYTISESTNSGSYANAYNLKWSSSNTGVVSVSKKAGSNKAILSAIGAGTANITVQTYNGKTATCKVTVSGSSFTPHDSKVYFEKPSWWHNYNDIRLYLYEVGGDVLIPWNSKKGKMTDENNGKWSFDFAAKGYTLSDSKTYACIFLTNTEMQTCDLFIGNPCLGDTAYCTGENNKIENTEDSNKKSWEVKWRNADPNRWGVPLAITSIGNIVGSALPAGTTKYDIFFNFLKDTGRHGVNNAVKFNGKSVQQTIDDAAKTLGLGINDVKKALNNCGISYDWIEHRSTIPVTPPSSVKLNRTTLTLGVGESYGLVNTVSSTSTGQKLTWSSSYSGIASVNSSGKVTGKKTGSTTVIARTSDGKISSCTVTVKPAPTSVKTNPASLTLGKGESYTISESTSSGSYANAANLKWTSSNTKVITVSKQAGTNKATLKAVGTGTANITIQTYNGKKATCKVTVKPAPTSIKINPQTVKLGAGEKYTISESTNKGSYAHASHLKWSVTGYGAASVSKVNNTNKATVTGKYPGYETVSVKTYNGLTDYCMVWVYPAPTSVKLSKTSLTLNKGKTYTISESTNSGSYSNAANLKWTSSNTKVATVTKGSGNKATIKAVAKGTAYIKITLYNGKTAQCKVTVK